MSRMIVGVTALACGIAITTPIVVASATDNEMQIAQAASDQQGRGAGGDAAPIPDPVPGMMGGMPEHPGMGMMGDHGMMMRRMMQLPPRQRCEERLARRAGQVAYTITKLNLTAQQRPLWDKLQGLMQTAADREHQLCAGLPADRDAQGQETILDRVNRREQFLSARLQGLQQVKPALEQLYQALTPEQKAIINHPFPGR